MTENSQALETSIRNVIKLEPGMRLMRSAPGSKEHMRAARDHFRSEERFQIVSRLLLYGTDEIDRIVSADNLGNFGRRGTPFLIRAVKSDPSARVRHHATCALARTGDPEAVQVLREALDDPDAGVRLAAAEALDVVAILSKVSPPETPVMEHSLALGAPIPVASGSKPHVMRDLEGMRLLEALSTLGRQRLEAGDYGGAAVVFTEFIDVTPENPEGYNGRGQAYDLLGKFREAIGDYSKAIELDAEYAPAYHNRGRSYRHLEEWERALADLERAVALDPSDPQLWYNFGTALLHFQELIRALDAFNRALGLRPDYVDALLNCGVIRFQSGEYEDALSDFSQALAHDPNRAAGYYNRALTYEALDRQKEADGDLGKARELDPVFVARLRGQA